MAIFTYSFVATPIILVINKFAANPAFCRDFFIGILCLNQYVSKSNSLTYCKAINKSFLLKPFTECYRSKEKRF